MDYEKEKQEAIMAGEKALFSLQEARNHLSGARGLGIWDLLGGGTLVSLLKHSKINSARQSIERARYDLTCFNKELNDISLDIGLDIGDFLAFFDIWDNFIADIIVQSRLADASNKIDEAIKRVQSILARLR